MLLKWITCLVEPQRRDAFDEAQQAWASLALCPDLVAQVGGWDEHDRACILGLWRDQASYGRFMEHLHDAIALGSAQQGTYRRSSVVLADALLQLPGDAEGLLQACAGAEVLRVADCTVSPGHRDHFVASQLSVWAPGLEATAGMRQGVLAVVQDRPQRFLVGSLWRTLADHDVLVRDRLPALRTLAGAQADLASFQEHRVRLEPGWQVLGRG